MALQCLDECEREENRQIFIFSVLYRIDNNLLQGHVCPKLTGVFLRVYVCVRVEQFATHLGET